MSFIEFMAEGIAVLAVSLQLTYVQLQGVQASNVSASKAHQHLFCLCQSLGAVLHTTTTVLKHML